MYETYLSESITINTAAPLGQLGKTNEGLVRCIELQHQSFLLHVALTHFLRSSNGKS